MRLTVLGSSASYAGPGQACAGYLVEHAGTGILLDCGNGALANLGRVFDPLDLDAVFVTHGHIDHFADVYSLQALLRYAPSGPVARLPLYLPKGVFDRLAAPLSGRGRLELEEAFETHVMDPGVSITIGALTVRPMPVDHAQPTYALRVESDVGTVCYTSDTAPGERAVAAARGCDLLLAEATLPQRYSDMAPHMTATQAARLAVDAGVREVVLTHVWPTNDRAQMLDEARGVFDGNIHIARELDTYSVSREGQDA